MLLSDAKAAEASERAEREAAAKARVLAKAAGGTQAAVARAMDGVASVGEVEIELEGTQEEVDEEADDL